MEQIGKPMDTHDTHKSLKRRFRYLKHEMILKIMHSNRNQNWLISCEADDLAAL